jgi:integrase
MLTPALNRTPLQRSRAYPSTVSWPWKLRRPLQQRTPQGLQHLGRTPLHAQQPSGPRLVAFFAVMYYAGLRPEEAINLAADNVIVPPPGQSDDDDWGELHIRSATPDAGSEWTDDGSMREMRQLKHRAEGDSRIVPTHPELTRLLRQYLANFVTEPDGRLLGGELPTITYRRAWIKARQTALSAAEQASPLVRRPYDLRHACLSTWLNGGVYPTQVAEWTGHSVDVLLRIYAKCVVGQDELAKRRIVEALRQDRDAAAARPITSALRNRPAATSNFGAYLPQRAADDGAGPHTAAYRCRIKDLVDRVFSQVTYGFLGWGGCDSNPGPADYESRRPAVLVNLADLGGYA